MRSCSIAVQRLGRGGATIALFLLGATATGATPAERARARWLVRQAEPLLAAGKGELACPQLAESQKLEPSNRTLQRLAECYETIGKADQAQESYRALADAAAQAGDAQLEKLAREKLAECEPPPDAEPLQQIGDTVWNGGVGLVRPGAAPPPPEATAAAELPPDGVPVDDSGTAEAPDGDGGALTLPEIADVDWSRVRGGIGVAVSYFTPATSAFVAPQLWGLVGYEHREQTSVWWPWFEANFLLGPGINGTEAGDTGGVITAAAHAGVDFYIPGWRWGTVGAFMGVGPKLFPGFETAADIRVDWLGAKLRAFTSAELPGFEVDLKVFLRASTGEAVAPYGGLFLSAGDSLRFMAFADVRFTEPGRTRVIAEAVSERVRFGLGALWF